MKTVPVVLAGGVGERFWPLSTSRTPKQLLTLVGGKSLLEQTLLRVRPLHGKAAKPVIVTSAAITATIRKRLPKHLAYDVISEPVGKNTAPAIALAAAYIERKYGRSVMVVVPADHAISPRAGYLQSARYAASIARSDDRLVVFGISPSRPDTGYGYLQIGRALGRCGRCRHYEVKRFVEKPDAPTAGAFLRSGKYLWNSGMFVWTTTVILDEFGRHMPRLYRQVREVERQGFSNQSIRRFYTRCQKRSVDYGIMEHSARVSAVVGPFAWDDIGSWESVSRLCGTDDLGTTVVGTRVFHADTTDSIVVNKSDRAIAVVGANDMVLVSTDDAVLAVPRSKLANIRDYVTKMKNSTALPRTLF
jgi:mannose-1-phosphate guanylyltransferase